MTTTNRYLREATYAQTRAAVEEATTLIPDAYTDADFFVLEQQQVFARNWTVAAPASHCRSPGDFITVEVAGQRIIVLRDEEGELRAFYNVCRHRGTRLCSGSGKLKKHIICPYHGWGYNLRGDCIGTPLFDKGANRRALKMHDMSHLIGFDKKNFGLFPVRVAQWGALIFVCLDDSAQPLTEVVGDLPQRLANYRLDEWTVLAERTYDIDCNWKLLFENAVEYYHLPWVHPRLAKTSRIVDHHRWQGDGMYCGICTSPITATDDAGWLTMKNLPGLNQTEQVSGYFFGLFPNVIIFVMPSHAFIIKAHPVAPAKTIETAWLVSHPDCVDDMSDRDVQEVMSFWDEVNREDVDICEKVQQGLAQQPYKGGRMCYHFEEPVHRFQNMVIDAMLGVRRVPTGDQASTAA